MAVQWTSYDSSVEQTRYDAHQRQLHVLGIVVTGLENVARRLGGNDEEAVRIRAHCRELARLAKLIREEPAK